MTVKLLSWCCTIITHSIAMPWGSLTLQLCPRVVCFPESMNLVNLLNLFVIYHTSTTFHFKLPGTGNGSQCTTHSAAQRNPWVAHMWCPFGDKLYSLVGRAFGECHAACTLKTSFIDFENKLPHCCRYKGLQCFVYIQLSIPFQPQSRDVILVVTSIPHFHIIFLWILSNMSLRKKSFQIAKG